MDEKSYLLKKETMDADTKQNRPELTNEELKARYEEKMSWTPEQWDEEVKRRHEALLSGEDTGSPWEEVKARIEKRFGR